MISFSLAWMARDMRIYASAFFSPAVCSQAAATVAGTPNSKETSVLPKFSVPLNSTWSICLSRSAIQVLGDESPEKEEAKYVCRYGTSCARTSELRIFFTDCRKAYE